MFVYPTMVSHEDGVMSRQISPTAARGSQERKRKEKDAKTNKRDEPHEEVSMDWT